MLDKKIHPAILDPMQLTVNQCRAARALLGWTAVDLAMASGVSVSSIRNFESGKVDMMPHNRNALIAAFEKAGLELLWNEQKDLVGVVGPKLAA